MARLRNYFLTGLIVTGPLAITVWLTMWLIEWIDSVFKPLIPARYSPDTYLPVAIPGFGVIIALVGLTLVGFLTANIVGKTLLRVGETLLDRMPIVRSLYRTLKQIFETVLSQSGNSFRKAALIEYPRKGLWSIVFVATTAKGELGSKLSEQGEVVSVFLPTTPNPTSGYLLYVPRADIIELDMSVEDAAKVIISSGLVTPEHLAAQQQDGLDVPDEKKTAAE